MPAHGSNDILDADDRRAELRRIVAECRERVAVSAYGVGRPQPDGPAQSDGRHLDDIFADMDVMLRVRQPGGGAKPGHDEPKP